MILKVLHLREQGQVLQTLSRAEIEPDKFIVFTEK